MSEPPSSCSENPHLQLCVNDLLHPTEKSEILLEELSATQLEEIERTLNKIKVKKQFSPKQVVASTLPIAAASLLKSQDWTKVAAQIAKALADTFSTSAAQALKLKSTKPPPITTKVTGTASDGSSSSSIPAPDTADREIAEAPQSVSEDVCSDLPIPLSPTPVTNHELRTEIRNGVEWVSFVYSHHRVLRRYNIRTDIEQIELNQLEELFKIENCVYPRANLPRDKYKGNRWAYETECNTLGWKLAYLNTSEIAGKRGLIQRAVDSYRNRYPGMRSRRVTRQEKLLKGTLRKRKQRDSEEPEEERCAAKKPENELPKTVSIDNGMGQSKCRIRINVDSVSLDSIDMEFRMSNCVYPRVMDINANSPFASQRQLEEVRCNELAWKLAWLNPKQLSNRKNLLQRVLDVYRAKFMPELNPRRNNTLGEPIALTADTLASKNSISKIARQKLNDENESQHSGSSDSVDSILSPTFTENFYEGNRGDKRTVSLNDLMLPGLTAASCANGLAFEAQSIFESPNATRNSNRSSVCSNMKSNVSSLSKDSAEVDDASFKDYSSMFDLYTDSSAICGHEQSEFIKVEEDCIMSSPNLTQLF
ncbi:hypothetical protein BY458DRAFT_558822 [Sporodiniella umbellata]|nr:hypothetical protein BY458DRAFT_558822 [Sporodiniella umbellata]